MIFPAAELKISRIMRSPSRTVCVLTLYRVDDGGLDDAGRQVYARTLKRQRVVNLDAGWDAPRVLDAARERLLAWAAEEGFNLPPERLICSL